MLVSHCFENIFWSVWTLISSNDIIIIKIPIKGTVSVISCDPPCKDCNANRAMPSLHRRSLEITLTVALNNIEKSKENKTC